MKPFLIAFFILNTLGNYIQSQQLSKHIHVDSALSEAGIQILEDGADDFLIPCYALQIDENNFYDEIIGFLNIDKFGNKNWSKTIIGNTGESLKLALEGTFIRDGYIFSCSRVMKGSYNIIRLWIMDSTRNIIKTKEYDIFNQKLIHIDGIIQSDNQILVYGKANDVAQSYSYILRVDYSLDLFELIKYSENMLQKGSIDLEKSGNGYILGFTERNASGHCSVALLNLDSDLNLVSERKLLSSDYFQHGLKLLISEDKDIYLLWGKDERAGPPLNYPFPDAIYRLNENLEVIWEYIFVHNTIKLFIDAFLTKDGSGIFGAGVTDYYNHQNIYSGRWSDAYCFLIDSSGNLIWERFISDIRETRGGRFWSGIETDEGFALIGDIDVLNPSGVPFLNDIAVWYLTLDKNGCWNGNCNRDIVITGETTSISPTSTKYSSITEDNFRVFPNPSSGILLIEYEDTSIKPRKIQVYDYAGKLVFEYELQAPKSTINLSHLPNGNYIGKISHTDGKIETKKIIIKN